MERLNRYIKRRMNMLRTASFSFEALFGIIHDQSDRVFCEYLDNFRITRITYRCFREYCCQTASYLKKRIEDECGAYVGLYAENSPHFLSAFWALLMLGYKPLLLNCRLPASLNGKAANAMQVKTVVSAVDSPLPGFSTVRIPAQNRLDEVICAETPYVPTVWADEIALTTTATTLDLKICVYTGRDFTYQMQNAEYVVRQNKMVKRHYKGELKLLTFLPFYHIFGLTAVYFWFAAFGRTMVFLKDYSSETITQTVRRHAVTHVFAVPLLWNTVAREIKKGIANLPEKKKKRAKRAMRFSLFLQNLFPRFGQTVARRLFSEVTGRLFGESVRFMISGGGYVSDETLYLLNAVGYPLYNGYGSTELGVTSVELRSRPKYRISGSVGKPLWTVDYKIEDGVLFVRGKSTCSRIVRTDGSSQTLDRDAFFDTHDNASVDRKGRYYITGRTDDVFVGENGEKIDPDLIEKSFLLTRVKNSCVLSLDGKLTLIFEVDPKATDLQKKQIAEEISDTLAKLRTDGYAIERVFFTCDKMTSENAIKVSRAHLKSRIAGNAIALHPYEQFREYETLSDEAISRDTLDAVKRTFAEVLGKDAASIGDDMHFIFDLGGSSLDYCTLLIRLQAEFGITFSFERHSCSTAKEFAQYILTSQGGSGIETVQNT